MKKARRSSSALVGAAGIAVAVAMAGLGHEGTKLSQARPPSKQSHATLPLAFEPNRGQAKAGTAFLARGGGYNIALRASEALFTLGKRDTLRMKIAGRGTAPGAGDDFQDGLAIQPDRRILVAGSSETGGGGFQWRTPHTK